MSTTTIETEVCIVGAGPAGAVLADALAARGIDVVVLESGPRWPLAGRAAAQRRYLRGVHPFPAPGPDLDRYTTDDADVPFLHEWKRMRGVGGASLHWEGYTLRFTEADFELSSRYGIARDWPLGYADVEPYYGEAERALGVAGRDGEAFLPPRSSPYPLPPFPFSWSDRALAPACEAAGVTMHSFPQARNSEAYGGRAACLSCGTCHVCPTGAKATVDLTHVARAEASGHAVFRERCHVVRLVCDARGTVEHVRFRDGAGGEGRVHARRYALAASGIENVRLALLSACPAHPDGLGNRSGLLGAHFMCHPAVDFSARVATPLYPHRTGFASAMARQFSMPVARERVGAYFFEFRNRAGMTPADIARAGGAWGRALREKVRAEFGHQAGIRLFLEHLPDPASRVTLDPGVRDAYGDPVARVAYRIGAYERATIAAAAAVVGRIWRALDATEPRQGAILTAAHLIGTHRMGTDPRASVVDPWQRVHDVPNLLMLGSGSFVTSSWAPPTLTIVALALRTAETLAAELR